MLIYNHNYKHIDTQNKTLKEYYLSFIQVTLHTSITLLKGRAVSIRERTGMPLNILSCTALPQTKDLPSQKCQYFEKDHLSLLQYRQLVQKWPQSYPSDPLAYHQFSVHFSSVKKYINKSLMYNTDLECLRQKILNLKWSQIWMSLNTDMILTHYVLDFEVFEVSG